VGIGQYLALVAELATYLPIYLLLAQHLSLVVGKVAQMSASWSVQTSALKLSSSRRLHPNRA
jgi:hypothetical protein